MPVRSGHPKVAPVRVFDRPVVRIPSFESLTPEAQRATFPKNLEQLQGLALDGCGRS
jgi:hypothetical protein